MASPCKIILLFCTSDLRKLRGPTMILFMKDKYSKTIPIFCVYDVLWSSTQLNVGSLCGERIIRMWLKKEKEIKV